MSKESLELIVFQEDSKEPSMKDGPATVKEKIKKKLSHIEVDMEELQMNLDKVERLVMEIASDEKRKLTLDSVSFQLGISTGGSVGLLGSSVSTKVAASFTLTFKTNG